jgi:propanol-preferring alcohol dehydrogenase
VHSVRLHQLQHHLVDETLPDPRPGEGEVLVEIHAAGICHSDAHYRAGAGRVNLPLTLGHEIAGVVAGTGERVALHYLMPNGDMLGKERDGGYAQKIVVPATNAVPIPDEVSFEQAAVMMCSTATAWHALKLATIIPGESVALLGFGGLGVSAAGLARIAGAGRVIAVDVVAEKRALARTFGAEAAASPEVLDGIDVVLDFAGHPATTLAALRALSPGGRLILVAINLRSLQLDPYSDVLTKERHIIGCADHTRDELVEVLELARCGALDMSRAITRRVPLEARAINEVLDDLERGTTHLRTVITARSR